MNMKKIPVLVYTDIGDDIDDSLAILYLALHPDIDIVGIICDATNHEYRIQTAHHLLAIFNSSAPILQENYNDILENILTTYNQDLIVLSVGPTTQLYNDIQKFTQLFTTIKRIYFQGQIKIHDGKLSPNTESYNFAQDQEAIQHILEYNIPMTFVGKYAAYELPFTKSDFEILAKKNTAWEYIYEQAQQWKARLKKLNPEVFQRLYEKNSDIMSYPYDLITAATIHNDEKFIKTMIGNRECIGQEKDVSGIKNISAFKKYMMDILAYPYKKRAHKAPEKLLL